jgi:hypothetical protein
VTSTSWRKRSPGGTFISGSVEHGDPVGFLLQVQQTDEELTALILFPVVVPVDLMKPGEDPVLPGVIGRPVLGENGVNGRVPHPVGAGDLAALVHGGKGVPAPAPLMISHPFYGLVRNRRRPASKCE